MTARDRMAIEDSPVVVSIAGELDAADPGWSEDLEATIELGAREIVVDLLNVTFADSSVVRALVRAHQRTLDTGWVRLVYTQSVIRRVIDICGLTDDLPQFPTVEAALRGVPSRLHPDDSPYAPSPSESSSS